MDLVKKLSIFVLLLCVLIALRNQKIQKPETDSPSLLEVEDPNPLPLEMLLLAGDDLQSGAGQNERLTSDFYRESCPSAEDTIRSALRELYAANATLAPQLLRLAFHDCFVSGCDASIMLDSDANFTSEKAAPPNLSLKGFEVLDDIKSMVELECPGIVSCADIVALAARESVMKAGGIYYPVLTGRLDSKTAFLQNASDELPSPSLDVKGALDKFAKKGFTARETIALLGGGHSTGKIHCSFIRDRLFDFRHTKGPDTSIDAEFLEVLRAECSHPSAPSPSPTASTTTFEDRAMNMDYEGVGKGFGEVYYKSLLRGRGLLFVDQQLTTDPKSKAWVETYLSDIPQFPGTLAKLCSSSLIAKLQAKVKFV